MEYKDILPSHIDQLRSDGILVSERGDNGKHEIQANDEAGFFASDPDAWRFARAKAKAGVPAYVEVLKFIAIDNPEEIERINGLK